MHHRKDEQPIGARRDPNPFVGHRVITRADRVDADHLGTATFDFADARLDRVAVVVFGDTENHEKLGMLPIRLTKFPECATHRVDARSRHVDRTKAAMRRVIWRTETLCPEACEALRLIATGEKREFFGRLFA